MVEFTVSLIHCLLFICLFAFLTILTTLYCCQQMHGVEYEMCTVISRMARRIINELASRK